jgi:carboxymethylenebutenolidase
VPVGTILRQSCPVVASYGAEDRTLRGAATKLSAALEAAGADYDIKEYPEAGHSFMNNHPSTLAVLRGAAGPDGALPGVFAIFNVVVGRPLMKTRYAEPQAADARGRIIDFFDRHLASAQDSARDSPGESG